MAMTSTLFHTCLVTCSPKSDKMGARSVARLLLKSSPVSPDTKGIRMANTDARKSQFCQRLCWGTRMEELGPLVILDTCGFGIGFLSDTIHALVRYFKLLQRV